MVRQRQNNGGNSDTQDVPPAVGASGDGGMPAPTYNSGVSTYLSFLTDQHITGDFIESATRNFLPTSAANMLWGGPVFNPDKDIPDLSGKVFVVTGGNAGIGYESCLQFAKHGAKVYMASRTESKANEAIEKIKQQVPNAQLEFLCLDLTSLASVKAAAESFLSRESRLDVFLNNAGIMAHPVGETTDGFEIQLGTNHIGHFYFTKLLLPIILKTAESAPPGSVRIVTVSSEGHRMAPEGGIGFEDTKLPGASTWTRYGQSKLANVLFSKELAKRYGDKNILALSLHPGVISTGLADTFVGGLGFQALHKVTSALFSLILKTPYQGALNSVALSASQKVGMEDNGLYFIPVLKKDPPSKWALDKQLPGKLWEWTEKVISEKGFQ